MTRPVTEFDPLTEQDVWTVRERVLRLESALLLLEERFRSALEARFAGEWPARVLPTNASARDVERIRQADRIYDPRTIPPLILHQWPAIKSVFSGPQRERQHLRRAANTLMAMSTAAHHADPTKIRRGDDRRYAAALDTVLAELATPLRAGEFEALERIRHDSGLSASLVATLSTQVYDQVTRRIVEEGPLARSERLSRSPRSLLRGLAGTASVGSSLLAYAMRPLIAVIAIALVAAVILAGALGRSDGGGDRTTDLDSQSVGQRAGSSRLDHFPRTSIATPTPTATHSEHARPSKSRPKTNRRSKPRRARSGKAPSERQPSTGSPQGSGSGTVGTSPPSAPEVAAVPPSTPPSASPTSPVSPSPAESTRSTTPTGGNGSSSSAAESQFGFE